MSRYKEITEARELLDLSEQASMEEIKSNYRKLLNKWHPDKCGEDSDECLEMTTRLIAAYKVIVSYCEQYKYSFTEEAVVRTLTGEDWWLHRFGDDPLWGRKED